MISINSQVQKLDKIQKDKYLIKSLNKNETEK